MEDNSNSQAIESSSETISDSGLHTYHQAENSNTVPIGLKYSRLYLPMIIIAVIFLFLIFSHLFFAELHHFQVNLLLSLIGFVSLLKIILVVKSEFYVPFIHIRNWSLRVKANDYSVRLPTTSEATEFNKLAVDLNVLTEILQFFSDEFRDKVKQQTSIIKDQDDSLRILYKTATTINNSHQIEDTYQDFLKILTQLTSAHAGAIRLISHNPKHIDQLEMVASIGLSDEFVSNEEFVPVNRCLCGNSFTEGKVKQLDQVKGCEQFAGTPLFDQQGANILVVPIEYQEKFLGIYNLYLSDKNINIKNKDHEELLITVGKQLGIAMEKFKLLQLAKQNSVMKERTLLAHELHDSLAQTLASLRFQVTIMEENIHEKIPLSQNEVEKLHGSIDEAYTEVRALITHFRAPVDSSGLIPAITKLVDNFNNKNNFKIFFQNNWKQQNISSDHQYQLVRIIQESLGNIKKHSQAKTVRLLLKTHDDINELLIEDDGIGFTEQQKDSSLGEHIGLKVMKDRAKRMNGIISIDSEPGEGTQILLEFPLNREDNQ
ncbi:MAG: GAF domain-containing protein [Gammaproteobacteria bacterium]|nr:GAF domain-containing protein [Gammaproteobacteria bacterium]